MIVKNVGPRLRELAPVARGSQDAGSRNLRSGFLTVPVLGLLPPARPPRPVVLSEDHLDVAGTLLEHAVRRRQHVPIMS